VAKRNTFSDLLLGAGSLRIAVVGTGVAGSYLLNRLPAEHEVEAFEMREEEKWWAVCAWGTSAPFISDLVKMAGLNFDDYILHRGKRMVVDPGNGSTFDIKLSGLVTFDKTRLFRDMKTGKKVHWGAHIKDINDLKGFDMVIDATGFHRSLMPKLEHDAAIPCFEVEVEGKFPWDDFYIKPYPGLTGYFWYFPLGEGRGHIGAGDFRAQYRGEIEAMIKKYDWKVVRRIGRPVRILPPAYIGPFYTEPRCTSCGKTIRNTKLLKHASTVSSSKTARTTVLSSSSGQVATTAFADGGGSSHDGATRTFHGPVGLNGHGWCDCSSPKADGPLVVGVGESVGSVYPLLGEGIIPSMQCVNLFVENIQDMDAYSDAVLKHFDVYAKVYRFIKAKVDGNFSLLRQFPEMASIYWHMRTNERRYGLETKLGDILKVINV
jgi:flavin-dependent dehydrogenase